MGEYKWEDIQMDSIRILSEAAVDSFCMHMQQEEKSAFTVEKYLRDMRVFRNFIGDSPITKELTIRYKQYLTDNGYAAASVNSMLAAVNSLMAFLGWHECRVKTIRVQRKAYCPEDKELTKVEYLRLMQAARDQRMQLLLQTLCATGIRVSELRYFTVEAMRRGEIMVHCKNKIRTIFVPARLKTRLLAYAKKQHITKGQIFVTRSGKPMDRSNIWAAMKSLCRAAKVNPSKVFPHNLRKLFARTFYQMDKDIAKLADILGHGNIETTRIYIMTTGAEHRRQIERMGLII